MSEKHDQDPLGLERMIQLLAQVKDAWPDRPHDALLLMKQAFAEYNALPPDDRKVLDETFQTMAVKTSKPN